MAKQLSPAAQAVLSAAEDAYGYNYSEFYCCADRVAATALRAAAEASPEIDIPFAVVDEWERVEGVCASYYAAAAWGYKQVCNRLLAIADELEGAQ